jgi:hypothetical protein
MIHRIFFFGHFQLSMNYILNYICMLTTFPTEVLPSLSPTCSVSQIKV